MGFKKTSALTATSTSALSAGGASTGPAFIAATSTGTVTTVGNYTIHTFLSSGTFTVTAGINKAIEYLIIAGGGAGGFANGTGSGAGGGGAGGFLESYISQTIGVDFSGARIYVTNGDVFTVTVGAGGVASVNTNTASDGTNSSIVGGLYNVTAIGGGGGGKYTGNQGGASGRDGGSSGAPGNNTVGNVAGQCVLSPRQGYRGGGATGTNGYGGGGAGGNGSSNAGGAGRTSSISGASVTYAAGGAQTDTPVEGATNTGNGGTALTNGSTIGRNGGSGIVIIRYLFQ